MLPGRLNWDHQEGRRRKKNKVGWCNGSLKKFREKKSNDKRPRSMRIETTSAKQKKMLTNEIEVISIITGNYKKKFPFQIRESVFSFIRYHKVII
jgi:hypothetical protein